MTLIAPSRSAGIAAKSRRAQANAQVYNFPAPVRGWVTAENLATAQPGGAVHLRNMVPTLRGARVRGGAARYASLGTSCTAIMKYLSGTNRELFAATESAIYKITSVSDPISMPAASLTGQTSGNYSYVNFSTPGGQFLIAVNGSDQRVIYDGTVFTTSPAMTGGPGTNGSKFSSTWIFKSRVWFTETQSLTAWYLPVDSIGGALVEFPLRGVFRRGGSLVLGSSWSQDTGAGLDDRCLFVTAEGEVAVYQGNDPSDASTWALVGVYDLGRVLGRDAIARAGGDVIFATDDGLIPLSTVIQKDPAALSLNAISRNIEHEWRSFAAQRRSGGVTITKWSDKGYAIIGAPALPEKDGYCLAVNLNTGAWSDITGWDVASICEYAGDVYFGTQDGRVYLAEVGGTDDGTPYQCSYIGSPSNLGSPAAEKQAKMARATFVFKSSFNYKISTTTDYRKTLESFPSSALSMNEDVWDNGKWDSAVWDSGGAENIISEWRSVYGNGFAFSPVVQITSGTENTPDIEIISFDLTYSVGGIIT